MGRVLGRSGIEVSEVGFGCWAIGGPAISDGMPDGWGDVDDEESVAALRRGLELGVTEPAVVHKYLDPKTVQMAEP